MLEHLRGKKLLLLAGAALHVKVVEAAKKLGVYIIVTDYLSDSPAKKLADEAWLLDIKDVDGIVKRCREEGVEGVLNFCIDPGQIPQQQICEALGFPSYGTAEQYFKLTNKSAFKAMCSECGVGIIPTYPVPEEGGEPEGIVYPVYVKPEDSRGSRGQTVCHNKEELTAAIAYGRTQGFNGKVLIEKYMGGCPDFCAEYFFVDGEGYLVKTTDRHLGPKADGLDKLLVCGVAPSDYTERFLATGSNDRVIAMLKKLGIQNGPVFMQGFVDGDEFRFYDPGLRFPGTDYETLLAQLTGVNLMNKAIEYALTGKITDTEGLDGCYLLGGKRSVQVYPTCRPGTIARLEGLEAIAKLPETLRVSQRGAVGQTVEKTGDVRQRIAEIVTTTAPDSASIKRLLDTIDELLVVEDENGSDLRVPYNYFK